MIEERVMCADVPAGVAKVDLSRRDLSVLRYALMLVRAVDRESAQEPGGGIVGVREGESSSDVLAAIIARAERVSGGS